MQSSGLLSNIITLWRYLGKKLRAQFILLFLLMLASVLAEVVSIGAVLPFLSALTVPDVLFDAGWAQPFIKMLGIQTANELLFPLTLAFVAATVSAAGIRVFQLWFNSRLTAVMGTQLRSAVYTITLNQSYEFHITHNSSDLISLTTEKVGAAVGAGIMHVLMLLTALIMSSAIIGTLLYINIHVALLVFIVLGGSYIIIGHLVRKRIKENSIIVAENQPQSVKCMQEGLGGIREVIIENSQEFFSHTYRHTINRIQYALMENVFFGGVPKSLLEAIGIILIVLMAYSLQTNPTAQQNVFPLLGAFALGAQRLLPNLQRIYFSWSIISGHQAILADVLAALAQADFAQEATGKTSLASLCFSKNLVLRDINFQYPGSDKNILKNIQLDNPYSLK
ncbi:MAG: ABC transporter ATP-binding protein [Candidatus Electrothrix sp. AR3]|nr:ABC transporter ATP-binding protein [Candidatus Electrothrix sp. AR3]